jgi:hypothetical protein
MPERIQLSRAKGWRMPENTVKVDRTTKWGNPLIVGKHGTREECVKWLALAINGYTVISLGKDEDGSYIADKLIAYRKHLLRNWRHLAGKNLACWCPLSAPCHVDLLLEAVHTLAERSAARKAHRAAKSTEPTNKEQS